MDSVKSGKKDMLKIAHCVKINCKQTTHLLPTFCIRVVSSSPIVVDSILLTKWWVRTVHLLFTMILERFFRTIDAN